MKHKWIPVKTRLPKVAVNEFKYFSVKLSDGTKDRVPFRNKPKKNILGFMTEEKVTHWLE